ncbi:uncharacterized protein C7orf50 homolog [Hemiscyllium ocellatum]|uniref:uncharacterized protein C7orf50 homolog n=1 Tax=Hemiscyllium ocellatum TaxID=170820 RepID=UPI002967627F|nr:uncharacterized protein C7orf50 homolog [Hemiscyllium ocellatum]
MAKGKRRRSDTQDSQGEEPTSEMQPDVAKAKRKKRSRDQDIEEERMEIPVQQEQEELTAEEKRKIERKLKKERKKKEKQLLREADALGEKVKPQPSASDLALKYLKSWSKERKNWKFQKTRQTWLLKHMYDRTKISDKHFARLLKYLNGLKGKAREETIQKAEALMKEFETTDDCTEDISVKIERIRQVLQLLS